MERRLTWDHFGGGIDGSEDLGVEPHLLSEQPGELLGPWGHKVSNYAVDGTYIGFLDFFTALGGVPAFGYPKSEARYDNDPRRQLGIAVSTKGFIRQYFQAAVMEYHPEHLVDRDAAAPRRRLAESAISQRTVQAVRQLRPRSAAAGWTDLCRGTGIGQPRSRTDSDAAG